MARILAVVALAFTFIVVPLRGEVRPISEAERAAVQIAVDYLARGPAAVAERLATTSALSRLTPAEQLAEIETRLGSTKGSRWELQTVVPALKDRMAAFTIAYSSGIDDQVFFDLVSEGGTFRVADIRMLAQPSTKAPLFTKAVVAPAPASATTPGSASRTFRAAPVGLALFAAAISFGAAFIAQRRREARALAAAALLILGAASWLTWSGRAVTSPIATATTAPQEDHAPMVAPLLALRRALTSGEGDVEAIYRAVDRRAGRGAIADLWRAQSKLLTTDTAGAKALLAGFPSPSDRPLAEIVRGRIGLLDGDEASAAVSFENAVNLGPGRDAVWYESADVLASLGFEEQAAAAFRRLARLGTRDANVYYQLAVLAAADDRDDDAERYLRTAWNLRPVPRERLVTTGAFWSLLRRPSLTSMIGFSAPAEAVVVSPAACTRPIEVPQAAEVKTTGELFGVSIGDAQLLVPGGAALAPPGTVAARADAWSAEEEARRIADLPALLSVGANPATYAQPALRQRLTGTALALSARNRWSDLVQLTNGVSGSAEHVPPTVIFLRSEGLQKMARHEESKRLITEIAASRVLQRKKDATALMQLAELFAGHDLYDAAVRMYDRAQAIRPNPFVDDRVRQIQTNKRLATKFSVHSTKHFDVRYPDGISATSAASVGTVLETELARLQEWIPVPSFARISVNVLSWQEFRSTYTGSDFILGFYNGRITVPFAGVNVADPMVVGILAHELAHAMIAQATSDHAPSWFHEGLAQRIEKRPYHANAFNMYDDAKLLPIALLDAVLHGSPDPNMIGAAYVVAQTDVRYIEEKYGKAGLRTMLHAFREGATTAEAIERLSGKRLDDFEAGLRQWGRSDQRVFDNREVQ